MIIVLQNSLELDGKYYAPGEEVDVPEELYDSLVESILIQRSEEQKEFEKIFKI